MITVLLKRIIYWLNPFSSKTGISSIMSPATIVEGCPHPDFSQNHIDFGVYTMVHTSTMHKTKSRDIPAIDLKSLNETRRYMFTNLLSGKKICAIKWKQKSIPDKVIAQA